ncbi:M28 family metallopeptidase [Candidatus Arthromitus sp. SFB-rat-Yit]|uniref:M28 family metallopeptidase n=1 Tax=Candidatus Arthromitus sp. SFB-rat-Yit TaxID=1041504 RepID=UPI000227A3EF|nr:M28 family peptidase [Candidatus Arthromitus sp. SFB-rat-Yit]BAK80912.1 putative peptidase M28 [Candidatus Arthromitus sp. SFB-rat-Yit]
MKNFKIIFKFLSILLLSIFTISNLTLIKTYPYSQNKLTFGKVAIKHISHLSKTPRISGTKSIINAQKYIKNEFQKYGYEVQEQVFSWPLIDSKNTTSKNIIAFKKGINNSQIIIGAHYDSTSSNGADDNASGVSVLLELAQKLNNITLPYSIKFIAFDAEELGLFGSRYYVKNMNNDEKLNTLLYINIDSILTGDNLYIYGNNGNKGWFRDEILKTSKNENIDIKTSPELISSDINKISILEGDCYDYSDHVYFKYEGIPFAYFESTSWDDINLNTGYPRYRNKEFGMVIHSSKDNLKYILNNIEKKSITNLSNCISLLYKSLLNTNKQLVITTDTNDQSILKNIRYDLYQNNKLIKSLYHNASNKIEICDLPKGRYKLKQINNTNLDLKCSLDNKYFNLSEQGTMYLFYENFKNNPKLKDYDGMLIQIYGDTFDDPQTSVDELYKEFIKIKKLSPKVIYNKEFSLEEIKSVIKEYNKNNFQNNDESVQTFANLSIKNNFLDTHKNSITKFLTSILLTIFCSNIYKTQKASYY